jgi:hypothetical protein
VYCAPCVRVSGVSTGEIVTASQLAFITGAGFGFAIGFLLAALLAQRHYERLRKIPTIKPTRSPSR